MVFNPFFDFLNNWRSQYLTSFCDQKNCQKKTTMDAWTCSWRQLNVARPMFSAMKITKKVRDKQIRFWLISLCHSDLLAKKIDFLHAGPPITLELGFLRNWKTQALIEVFNISQQFEAILLLWPLWNKMLFWHYRTLNAHISEMRTYITNLGDSFLEHIL